MIKSIPQLISEMTVVEKWNVYCAYLRKYFTDAYFKNGNIGDVLSFPGFCDNTKAVIIGENWKEQGYAQDRWIDYPLNSLGYWITHNVKF
jgi:hypothetical protein